jgi:hypothetical protein
LVAALKIEAKMKLYTWSLRSKLKQKLYNVTQISQKAQKAAVLLV